MDRITKGYMNNFAASQELTGQNGSELFELFACYCVLSKEYPEHFDISDIVTGGGSDAGIDGIAIIANNVLIHSQEEFDDLAEQTHTITDLKFIFIQAKTSPTFNGGDIATFGFGVCDLLKEQPELVQNAEVQEKSNIISHILSNMMRVRNKPKCLLYYVTTGNWTEDQNLCSRIEGVKSDLKSENLFSEISFVPVDANYLQKLFKNTVDKIQAIIDFPERITLPEMEKVKEAYLGILPACQFLNLVSNEDGIIKSILYDNVRDFQGENDVNVEIAETLNSSEADKFVILNNGITIICKELKNIVRNQFSLEDYQIVNGCQTSHVLYNNKETISDKVYVAIKIISTDDEETVNKIVKATNRQTEVTDEQLLVNEFKSEEFIDMDTKYFDKQNIRLKAESVNEKELYGLYYDYDSSFEHGLWGAIRESSLLKCDNPAHKYHCVPDVEDEIRLKTVLPDCIMIMNKTVSFLNEIYGIPQQMLNGVINFELKPIDNQD